jgi:hypothetical protein
VLAAAGIDAQGPSRAAGGAPPQPTPGVAAPNPRPAHPGRPLFTRPVALLLLFALPFAVAVLMIIALAIFG